MTKADMQKFGSWAFVLGVLVAVVAGLAGGSLAGATSYVALALVVLGLVVGFLNINSKEVNDFLIATIALLVVAASAAGLNFIPFLGTYLAGIVQYIAVFLAPAVLVVALKAVYALAKAK